MPVRNDVDVTTDDEEQRESLLDERRGGLKQEVEPLRVDLADTNRSSNVSQAWRWARNFVIWVVLCLLATFAATEMYTYSVSHERATDHDRESPTYPIVRNPNDIFRQYRAFQLPNGLDVACIFDPLAHKAAVSMNVHVGSFNDPPDTLGLAHFTEHMLFLGTSTFPDEKEFSEYLSVHDGSDNAYTSDEDTNYYLHVAPNGLRGALERFAKFFTEPLLHPDGVAREVNAVNSEFTGHKTNDAWHRQYLLKYVSSPKHPFHQFSTGNLETLNHSDSADRVRRFWHKYYHPRQRKLAVVAPLSLDTLENWTRTFFSDEPKSFVDVSVGESDQDQSSSHFECRSLGMAFPCGECCAHPGHGHGRHHTDGSTPFPVAQNRAHKFWKKASSVDTAGTNQPTYSFNVPVQSSGHNENSGLLCEFVGRVIKLRPFSGKHQVEMLWQVPYDQDSHISLVRRPLRFILHLLGHETKGSILHRLKELKWATSLLSLSPLTPYHGFSVIGVRITLTDLGFQNWESVTRIVFQYIVSVLQRIHHGRGSGSSVEAASAHRVWHEQQFLHNLSWHYPQSVNSESLAKAISSRMELLATVARRANQCHGHKQSAAVEGLNADHDRKGGKHHDAASQHHHDNKHKMANHDHHPGHHNQIASGSRSHQDPEADTPTKERSLSRKEHHSNNATSHRRSKRRRHFAYEWLLQPPAKEEFDAEWIQILTSWLTPSNVNIFLQSPLVADDKGESTDTMPACSEVGGTGIDAAPAAPRLADAECVGTEPYIGKTFFLSRVSPDLLSAYQRDKKCLSQKPHGHYSIGQDMECVSGQDAVFSFPAANPYLPYQLLSPQRLQEARRRRSALKPTVLSLADLNESEVVLQAKESFRWWPHAVEARLQGHPQVRTWWGDALSAPFEEPTMTFAFAIKTAALIPLSSFDATGKLWAASPDQDGTERADAEDGAAWRKFGGAPHATVRFAIFKNIVRDILSASNVEYFAQKAGISFKLAQQSNVGSHPGVELIVSGYAESHGFSRFLQSLLKVVFVQAETTSSTFEQRLQQIGFTESRFEIAKEKMLQSLEKAHMHSQAYQMAFYLARLCVDSQSRPTGSYLHAIFSTSLQNVVEYGLDVMSRGARSEAVGIDDTAVGLLFGQINTTTREQILGEFGQSSLVQDHSSKSASLNPSHKIPTQSNSGSKILRIPNNMGPDGVVVAAANYNPDDDNNALLVSIQIGRRYQGIQTGSLSTADMLKREVTLNLFAAIAKPSCFDQLRTRDTLGYTVACFPSCQYGDGDVCTFNAIMQGNKYSPQHMNERFENYITNRLALELNELTVVQFEKIRKDHCETYSETPSSLSEAAGILWSEIARGTGNPDFARLEKKANTCRQVSLDDVRKFFSSYVASQQTRRKLSIEIFSTKAHADDLKERLDGENVFSRVDIVAGESHKRYHDWF